MYSFNDFTANLLSKLNFKSLLPIQEKMLQAAKQYQNLLLLSPTGSGKTLAFLLPILKGLNPDLKTVQSIIIVPTRELALQIESVIKTAAVGIKVNSCYGGHPIKIEKNNFREPPAILVGTPGRLAAHIREDNFQTDGIQTIVLDEYDKSFELGFDSEIEFIYKHLNGITRQILTSATRNVHFPNYIDLNHFYTLNFLVEDQLSNATKLMGLKGTDDDKFELLLRLMSYLGEEQSILFLNHREAVDRINRLLNENGIYSDRYHGGLPQEERERVLIKFRNGSLRVLVTTDLASRGIDIPDIKNIIHYQPASNETAYIHRNGRTGRQNTEGRAWLLLAVDEPVPNFILDAPNWMDIPPKATMNPPYWTTLYIGGGKKDKITKVDIVGLLIHKGQLQKEEIGLIHNLDHITYAAIPEHKVNQVLKLLRTEKIKGKKIKIDLSR